MIAAEGAASVAPETRDAFVTAMLAAGYDPDAIAVAVGLESQWKPEERSHAGSTATGLLQWTEPAAKALATTTDAISRMSIEEQLPLIVAWYRKRFRSYGEPRQPSDYWLVGFGQGVTADAPDGQMVLREGERGWRQNAPLDVDKSGDVSVGELRARYQAAWEKAASRRPLPPAGVASSSAAGEFGELPPGAGVAVTLLASAILGVLLAIFVRRGR